MSVYPTGIDTFTNKTDGVEDVLAEYVNVLQSGITAIETVIGVSGSYNFLSSDGFVAITGDTMTGNLQFTTGLSIIMSPVNVGSGNTVGGDASTVVGIGNYVPYGVAFGFINFASGNASIAVGVQNISNGDNSIAFGAGNTANSNCVTLGVANAANGEGSTAVGNSNTITGGVSTAVGISNTTTGEASTAVGVGNTANGYGTQVIGKNVTGSLDETLYLGAPNGVMVQGDKHLIPEVNGTQDLGSYGFHWANLYTDTVFANVVSGNTISGNLGSFVDLFANVVSGNMISGNTGNFDGNLQGVNIFASVFSGNVISGDLIYRGGQEIDDLYVNVTGDMMTGELNIFNTNIVMSGMSLIKDATSRSSMFLNVSSILAMAPSISLYTISGIETSGNITPVNSGTDNLGNSDHPFSGVYSNQYITSLYATSVSGTQITGVDTIINWNNGASQFIDFTLANSGTHSIGFSNGIPGSSYVLETVQNVSGTASINWSGGSWLWRAGATGTMTVASGSRDIFSFYYNGNKYMGTFGNDYK